MDENGDAERTHASVVDVSFNPIIFQNTRCPDDNTMISNILTAMHCVSDRMYEYSNTDIHSVEMNSGRQSYNVSILLDCKHNAKLWFTDLGKVRDQYPFNITHMTIAPSKDSNRFCVSMTLISKMANIKISNISQRHVSRRILLDRSQHHDISQRYRQYPQIEGVEEGEVEAQVARETKIHAEQRRRASKHRMNRWDGKSEHSHLKENREPWEVIKGDDEREAVKNIVLMCKRMSTRNDTRFWNLVSVEEEPIGFEGVIVIRWRMPEREAVYLEAAGVIFQNYIGIVEDIQYDIVKNYSGEPQLAHNIFLYKRKSNIIELREPKIFNLVFLPARKSAERVLIDVSGPHRLTEEDEKESSHGSDHQNNNSQDTNEKSEDEQEDTSVLEKLYGKKRKRSYSAGSDEQNDGSVHPTKKPRKRSASISQNPRWDGLKTVSKERVQKHPRTLARPRKYSTSESIVDFIRDILPFEKT